MQRARCRPSFRPWEIFGYWCFTGESGSEEAALSFSSSAARAGPLSVLTNYQNEIGDGPQPAHPMHSGFNTW
jgi:hypothetical protein